MAFPCAFCRKEYARPSLLHPFQTKYGTKGICPVCNETLEKMKAAKKRNQYDEAARYFHQCLAKDVSSEVKEIINNELDAAEKIIKQNEDVLRAQQIAYTNQRIEELKAAGREGYYEFKVIKLTDEFGGVVDVDTMSFQLNELGLDGWRLVTAYSNEIGKNAFSVGLGSAAGGVNSTADEHILIFERYVKI